MSIDSLRKVLPVPSSPVETSGVRSWESIERLLGLKLPSDYKAYIETYGTGMIGYYVEIWNPFSRARQFNLVTQSDEYKDYLKETDISDFPFSLYPDPGGLLPFGATKDSDILSWKTKGSTEEWTIVVFKFATNRFDEYSLTFTDLLEKLISGQLTGQIFRPSEINKDKLFFVIDTKNG